MGDLSGQNSQVILLAGPTGSGKSRIAMDLARARNGVVINADSMQVYRELRVLTARPSADDEAEVAHRLYGHVGMAQPYSVGAWLQEVAGVIDEVCAQGQLPIVVGGTGLYFLGLIEGLAPIPEIDADVRAFWRGEGETRSAGELYEELEQRDGEMARRLRPSDTQRIVRALEVIDATGRSLADWQKEPREPVLGAGCYRGFVVERPREDIYRDCDARFEAMVADGGLDEARCVRDMQLDSGLPGMRAVGLRPLLVHLEGEIELEAAIEEGQRDTRHYVKRQLTWLRRNMNAWMPVCAQQNKRTLLDSFSFIDD